MYLRLHARYRRGVSLAVQHVCIHRGAHMARHPQLTREGPADQGLTLVQCLAQCEDILLEFAWWHQSVIDKSGSVELKSG